MTMKYLEVEQEEKILTIRLNNPKVNALNSALMQELRQVLLQAERDDNVYLLIITGNDKVFSAGADINELKSLSEQPRYHVIDFLRTNNTILDRIESFPKPIIAAVNGYALGGGCELALACHLRFASKDAKLGLPEINLGIFPGWGGTWRLPELIGKSRAAEMILTGKIVSADEALQIGLVDRAADSVELLNEVKEFSKILTGKPRDALWLAHRSILLGRGGNTYLFSRLLGGESAKKRIDDFLSKKG